MKDFIFGLVIGLYILFVVACGNPDAYKPKETIIVTPTPMTDARKELKMLYNPVYDDVCYYVDGIDDLECLSVN